MLKLVGPCDKEYVIDITESEFNELPESHNFTVKREVNGRVDEYMFPKWCLDIQKEVPVKKRRR